MTEVRRTFRFSGRPAETSWRLKLVGWSQIVWGALMLGVLLQVAIFSANLVSLERLRPLLAVGVLVLILLSAARIYAGLMVLDRSRSAGVLMILVCCLQVVTALMASPIPIWQLLWGLVSLALVASIWNELEGPLPFGLKTPTQVFLGISCVCLVQAFTPRPTFERPVAVSDEDALSSIDPPILVVRTDPYTVWADIARDSVPGFAGVIWERILKENRMECFVTVLLTDPNAQRRRALEYFRNSAARRQAGIPISCDTNPALRVDLARHDMAELNKWYELLHQENWRLQSVRPDPGSSAFLKIDPRANIVRVQPLFPTDSERLQQFADSAGIPADAVSISYGKARLH